MTSGVFSINGGYDDDDEDDDEDEDGGQQKLLLSEVANDNGVGASQYNHPTKQHDKCPSSDISFLTFCFAFDHHHCNMQLCAELDVTVKIIF